MRRLSSLSLTALFLSTAVTLAAQDTTRTRPDTTKPAGSAGPTAPRSATATPFEFSGILFANYQYGGLKGNRAVNRFEAERAYLTFRATPGEHFAIRITT